MKNILVDSTIAAISTPPGAGGIGIIRISGKEAFEIGLTLFRKKTSKAFSPLIRADIKDRYLYYGKIIDNEKSTFIDEVLIVFMKGPASYTAEDVVEIQAHSGRYILKKILSLVVKNGAKTALPGEFTKRAFLNGRIGLTQAESVMDLISSSSSASHKLAVSMAGGALGDEIKTIREMLVDMEAFITACVDFPDDVDEFLNKDEIKEKLNRIALKLQKLQDSHRIGHQLREGLKIAIVGPPNAGKSSLLNRLISKERSIVTSIPGTTRDVIEESVVLNGFPLVLSDTAGIRDTDDEVERIGVSKSREALEKSDLVVFLADGEKGFDKETKILFNEIEKFDFIFVVNKKDVLLKNSFLSEKIKSDIIYISALKNNGIEYLKKEIFVFFEKRFSGVSSSIIPNQRQNEIIFEIHNNLKNMLKDIDTLFDVELISYDLKSSIDLCSELLGDTISPDVLDKVFSSFCIGK